MQTSLVFIYHFQINYIQDTFDLEKPVEGIQFSQEIYNIPLVKNELSRGEHGKDRLEKLNKKVKEKRYDAFTSRKKTKRSETGQTSAPAGSGRGNMTGTAYEDPSVVYQLSRAGYELAHEIKSPGWNLLNPVCLL